MSVGIQVRAKGVSAIQRRLLSLPGIDFRAELLESVGALVESQTRQRIAEDKASPDGEAWATWSERYAKTRHGGHSLLQGEGDLLDSIQYLVNGDELEVGSNLVYAGTQQYGDEERGIPAREFLGLSVEDEEEVDDLLQEFIDQVLN